MKTPIEPAGDRWTWEEVYASYRQDGGKHIVQEHGALGLLALDLALHEDHAGGGLTEGEIRWLTDKIDIAVTSRLYLWFAKVTGKPYERIIREGVHTDYAERVEAYRLGFEETYL